MVSSNDFYNSWLRVIDLNINKLISNWDNNKDFTNVVIKNDNSIINQVSNDLNLLCYNSDYYSIDSVLYQEKDRLNEAGGTYLRHISVAFEHENDFCSGLFQEVAHLLITQADLKVLVFYPPHELNRSTNIELKNELNKLHEIISGSPYSKDISDKENFLLILGKSDKPDTKNWNINDYWKGLVYKNNEWKKIST